MREDDHLTRLGGALEHASEPVDLGGVHRLDRVVDDDEAERALGQRRAREEQAEREGVELALAHDAERRPGHAVDGHVERDPASDSGALELDVAELNAAAVAEKRPDLHRLVRDRREPVVADADGSVLEPGLGVFKRLDCVPPPVRFPCVGEPGRQVYGDRTPRVLALLQLLGGGGLEFLDRVCERADPFLKPARKRVRIGLVSELEPTCPGIDHRLRLEQRPHVLDRTRDVGDELARPAQRLRHPRLDIVRLLRRLALLGDLHLRRLDPGGREDAGGLADRAGLVGVVRAEREGGFEQLGTAQELVGLRADELRRCAACVLEVGRPRRVRAPGRAAHTRAPAAAAQPPIPPPARLRRPARRAGRRAAA